MPLKSPKEKNLFAQQATNLWYGKLMIGSELRFLDAKDVLQ